MAPSRDNMLEAFKDAKGKPGSVGGPFVGAAGGKSPAPAFERGPRANPRPFVVAFAALALAFVLGVLVGRGTAPAAGAEVRAAGGDDAAPETEGEPPAALAEDRAEPAADAAPSPGTGSLSDPDNKYTIVAISISPTNENAAWANVDHLRAAGFPAHDPVQTPNGMLAVLVGAAPKESDLADIKARLQRQSGPNGKGRPYEKAYTNPTRKLIKTDGD